MLKGVQGLREEAKKMKEEAIDGTKFFDFSRANDNIASFLYNRKRKINDTTSYSLFQDLSENKYGKSAASYFIKNFLAKVRDDISGSDVNTVEMIKKYESIIGRNVKKQNDQTSINQRNLIKELYITDRNRANEVMQNYWVEYFNKNIKDANIKAMPAYGANISGEKFDFVQFAKDQYDTGIERWIAQVTKNIDGFDKLNQIIKKGKVNLGSKFDTLGASLSGLVKSIKGLYDPIYRVAINYEKTIQHQEVMKKSRDFLGVGYSVNEARLKSFGTFFEKLQTVTVDLETRKKDLISQQALFAKGSDTKEIKELIKQAKEIGKRLNTQDTKAIAKALKAQHQNTADKTLLDAAIHQLDIQAKIMKVDNLIKIAEGKKLKGVSDFTGLKKDIEELLGGQLDAFTEMALKAAWKNKASFKDEYDKLVKAVIDERIKYQKISFKPKYQELTAQTRTKVAQVVRTDDYSVDRKKLYETEISNITDKYAVLRDAENERMSMLIKGSKADTDVAIAKLNEEEKYALAVAQTNYETDILIDKINRANAATRNLSNSLLTFFTNTENYKFENRNQFNAGIRGLFNSVGKNLYQSQMEDMMKGFNIYGDNNVVGRILTGIFKSDSSKNEKEKTQKKDISVQTSLEKVLRQVENIKGSRIEKAQVKSTITLVDRIGDLINSIDNLINVFDNAKKAEKNNAIKIKATTNKNKDKREPTVKSDLGSFDMNSILNATSSGDSKDFLAGIADAYQSDTALTKDQKMYAGISGVAANLIGQQIAKNNNKTGDMVMTGASFGMQAGMTIGAEMGSSGGVYGAVIGAIVGGIAGALMSSDEDKDKQNKTLERIAQNTAYLKELDSRLINAPSDFKMPAMAKIGGNIQYNGAITINIDSGGNDPAAIASEVSEVLGQGVSNFNSVGGI